MPKLASGSGGTAGRDAERRRRASGPFHVKEPDDEDARAAAEYIADMSGQLELMARAANLELLAYLLAMARAEADTITRLPAHDQKQG
jgi:hypothetical protein